MLAGRSKSNPNRLIAALDSGVRALLAQQAEQHASLLVAFRRFLLRCRAHRVLIEDPRRRDLLECNSISHGADRNARDVVPVGSRGPDFQLLFTVFLSGVVQARSHHNDALYAALAELLREAFQWQQQSVAKRSLVPTAPERAPAEGQFADSGHNGTDLMVHGEGLARPDVSSPVIAVTLAFRLLETRVLEGSDGWSTQRRASYFDRLRSRIENAASAVAAAVDGLGAWLYQLVRKLAPPAVRGAAAVSQRSVTQDLGAVKVTAQGFIYWVLRSMPPDAARPLPGFQRDPGADVLRLLVAFVLNTLRQFDRDLGDDQYPAADEYALQLFHDSPGCYAEVVSRALRGCDRVEVLEHLLPDVVHRDFVDFGLDVRLIFEREFVIEYTGRKCAPSCDLGNLDADEVAVTPGAVWFNLPTLDLDVCAQAPRSRRASRCVGHLVVVRGWTSISQPWMLRRLVATAASIVATLNAVRFTC